MHIYHCHNCIVDEKTKPTSKHLFQVTLAGLLFVVAASETTKITASARGYYVTPTISIFTDQRAYAGDTTIKVSGFLTQVQGNQILIVIRSPSGSLVASDYSDTDEYSGRYDATFKTGGPGWWEDGLYAVTASWQFCPVTATNRTTFMYKPATSTTSHPNSTTTFETVPPPCTESATMLSNGTMTAHTDTAKGKPTGYLFLAIAVGIAFLVVLVVGVSTKFLRLNSRKG